MTVAELDAPTLAPAPTIEAELTLKQRALKLLQTRAGRLVAVGVFTAMMFALKMPLWLHAGVVLALTSAFPAYRRQVIALAAIVWIFLEPPINETLMATLAPQHGASAWLAYWPMGVVIAWTIAWAYLLMLRRFPQSPIARRPILSLLFLFGTMLIVVSMAPLSGPAWFFAVTATMAFSQYLWFFAYTIVENASAKKPLDAKNQFGAWRPFWGFTSVPYGKGNAYLTRIEAKNDQQLAEIQLRGLKLLLRAACLTIILAVGLKLIYRSTGSFTKVPLMTENPLIPPYYQALEMMKSGEPYSLLQRWLALWASFFLRVTVLAIWGHKVIAILRMAGFDAFRNTYRPFSSTSIADLFNRVYYYFKELLVTFFFYPTYLRYFKNYPKLRLFTATLAAAGFGNFLFHFLRDSDNFLVMGPIGALKFYLPYAVYALLLGTAIALSQMRTLSRVKSPATTRFRRFTAIAGVLLFYTFICIFEEPNAQHNLTDYKNYFLSLFVP
jgi:hypothetical protein